MFYRAGLAHAPAPHVGVHRVPQAPNVRIGNTEAILHSGSISGY